MSVGATIETIEQRIPYLIAVDRSRVAQLRNFARVLFKRSLRQKYYSQKYYSTTTVYTWDYPNLAIISRCYTHGNVFHALGNITQYK